MSIQREIRISAWEHPYETLPDDVTSLFSPTEAAAYREGASCFRRCAQDTEDEQLISLLSRLDNDHPMHVVARREDGEPWFIWFGFTLSPFGESPYLRVRPSGLELPPTAPLRVRNVYAGFGGITNDSLIGGFLPPEKFESGTTLLPDQATRADTRRDAYHFFFSYGNGDFAGWHDTGKGVIFNHETMEIDFCEFDELFVTLFAGFDDAAF